MNVHDCILALMAYVKVKHHCLFYTVIWFFTGNVTSLDLIPMFCSILKF